MAAFFKADLGPFAAPIPVDLDGIDWGGGVLLRSTNWLGDAVMTLPGAYRLKEALPTDVKLTVVCPAKLAALWRSVPWIDDVFELSGTRIAAAERVEIRDLAASVAVVFPNSVGSAYDIWRCGVPSRIGRSGRGRKPLLTQSLPPYRRKAGKDLWHQARHYLEFATCFGSKAWDCEFPALRSTTPAKREAELLDASGSPVLVLAPGAAYGPAKQWSAKRFNKVAQWWAANIGPVISTGTGADAAAVEASIAGVPNATSLAGKTSLDDLVYVLSRARCILTNDSGTMHLGAALQRDGVAVFGSTDPIATGPIGGRWIICQRDLDCSPCLKRRCPLKEGAYDCLKQIQAEDVIAALEKLLAE